MPVSGAPALRGRKLGILLSIAPDQPGFAQGLRLAETALNRGVDVYLYCLDEGVRGAEDPALVALQARGLKLFACAYAAHRRNLPLTGPALYSGLGLLGDLVSATDRFVSFN